MFRNLRPLKSSFPSASPHLIRLTQTLALFIASSSLKAADPKDYNATNVQPKTAAEELASFTLPEGFTIELVASEETGAPKVAMTAFDDAGRLWSATATEYPRDNEPGIWSQPGKDRVIVFDTPLNNRPQTARTFAEGMVMPLSVLPYGRGAFIAQGPEIFYLDDKNGDGKADDRRVLIRGFGVQDTHTLPHQLTLMPGGRIVFSQGVLNDGKASDSSGKAFEFNKTLIGSIKPDGTDTRIIGAGLNNIWAWAHSRTGKVFFHEANDLGYSVVPFEEDSTYPSFKATKLHPNAPIHPPTAEGLNLGGTGFSGMAICDDKAGSYPAPWHGLLFVANPILGIINAVSATPDENGVWAFKKQPNLVSSSDPMFRPVALTFGPDGCLYITDWYNRIISHNEVARNHPGRDKERGRIWRVRHQSQPPAHPLDLTKVSTKDLPSHLFANNTWEMRAAWHQIGQRQAKDLIPALSKILTEREVADDVKIHALWSIEDLGHFDPALWRQLLAQPSPDLRREAIRALSTLRVPEDQAFDLLQPLRNEPTWTVRYEILRFFRRAAGPVNPDHITWLRTWNEAPAPQNKVKGWGGTYLALGGSYERSFQNFLLLLAESKTSASQATESRWDKVLATWPDPSPEQADKITKRIASVKLAIPKAIATQGQIIVETTCLSCHSIAGKGVGFAPPLDGSSKRDLDGLITAIVAPDAATENVFRLYRLEKKDGTIVEGFKRAEDAQGITMVAMGGAETKFPSTEIKSAGYVQGRSMMPDLTAGMTDSQVAEIVAYLRTVQ